LGGRELYASVFLGALHRPALASRPGRGGRHLTTGRCGQPPRRWRDPAGPGAKRRGGRAAIRGGQACAAILAGRHGESLVIEAAASPGTAAALTKGFTTAAAAIKIPLQVRDVAPLPASDPTGVSVFFLIIAWTLGGYIGATVIATAQLMVSSGLRHVAIRLALLAGYAAVFGLGGPRTVVPRYWWIRRRGASACGFGELYGPVRGCPWDRR
jgi:hypothetical protein